MGRMTPDRLHYLREAEAFHVRELARVQQEIREGGHEQATLYHESQRKRWTRLRALSRALLFLLLAFAPLMRDILRAALRSLGVDL